MAKNVVRKVKSVGRKVIRRAAPVLRPPFTFAAKLGTQLSDLSAKRRVVWSDTWTKECDAALDALPSPSACTRDHYRMLTQPTAYPKRHALVLERDVPVAVVSLRARGRFWEPVAYQSLPGFVAPARDVAELGGILNGLGLHIRMDAGLGPDVARMGARHSWSYDAYQVDLQGPYEDHWLADKKKQQRLVKEARKKGAAMDVRFDGEGDLAYLVNLWHDSWVNDPEQEIRAAPDRLRFWSALQAADPSPGQLAIHTCVILDGGRPVAGAVHSRIGDNLMWQIAAREDAYRKSGVGTRALDASLIWAKEKGWRVMDLGGGNYKSAWGPARAVRHGAVFQPRLTALLES